MVSAAWVHSHVSHHLPIGERVSWNVLMCIEIAVYVDDVVGRDTPVHFWAEECQCSCNVLRTVSISPHEAHNDRFDILWMSPELPVATWIVRSLRSRAQHDDLLVSASGRQMCYWGRSVCPRDTA